MFGSTVLEVAIGLVFVFLFFSLLVSGASELISAVLQLRARNLEHAVGQMLGTKKDDFFGNALIEKLGSPRFWIWKASKPSYIPPKNFSEAVLRIIAPDENRPLAISEIKLNELVEEISTNENMNVENAKGEVKTFLRDEDAVAPISQPLTAKLTSLCADETVVTIEQLRRRLQNLRSRFESINALGGIETVTDPKLAQTLSMVADRAAARSTAVRDELETWFNDSMHTASGWYKKKITIVNLLVAAVIAILLNVDSIRISNRLANDPTVRKAIIAHAQTYQLDQQKKIAKNSSQPQTAGADADSDWDNLIAQKQSLEELQSQINRLGLPIGWSPDSLDRLTKGTRQSDGSFVLDRPLWLEFVDKILGLGITVLAISVGAPFWFNMLSHLMRIYRQIPPADDQQRGRTKQKSSSPETA